MERCPSLISECKVTKNNPKNVKKSRKKQKKGDKRVKSLYLSFTLLLNHQGFLVSSLLAQFFVLVYVAYMKADILLKV